MGLFSKKEYKAVINYIDLDNDLMSIGSSTEVTGQEGDSIDFDPTNEIKLREREGYVLVKDKFSEGKERTFTNDTQVFLITFKHGERPVNPEHPLTKIPTEEYKKPITEYRFHFYILTIRPTNSRWGLFLRKGIKK